MNLNIKTLNSKNFKNQEKLLIELDGTSASINESP